jgi:thioester reductase-like protein
MSRTVLFTGFPGFIGARLIRRLLDDDAEVTIVALVETRMTDRARAAAAALSERIVVEPGDITAPRLGLSPERYAELAGRVTSVAHLAAVYDLAVPMEIAEAVNVTGTQNVLDFCRACTSLERHNYVSTAYVAGLRSGRVLEGDLAAGQTFKNHYESTKFAAEVLVRASMDKIPTTIYRPAIVVGDSRTGETQKFDGPYYVLRYVSLNAGRPLPMLQTGSEDSSFNVVPVDFVVEAMAAGIRDTRMTGETLHLVDPAPVSAAELVRLLTRTYADRRPTLRLPQAMVESTLRVPALRRVLAADTPVESIAYLNHPVTFDTTRATALLAEHGLHCPRFPDYVGAMVRFFREHEADPAYVAH